MSGDAPAPSVCFFSSVRYPSPLDPTSAKKFRALEALGDVVVIGFSTGLAPRSFVEGARFRLLPGVPLPLLRYALLFTWGSALALASRSQVIVAQSPYEGVGAALVKLAARAMGRRVALVVESHGDFETAPFLQRRFLLPALWRSVIARSARFSFRHADALRAISGATASQLERWAPGRTTVSFPTWTDIDPFLRAGEESTARKDIVLYAGVLTPLKAVDVLLAAFARIAGGRECRLRIVGSAEDPAYARRLVNDARTLGISGRVDFLPAMPQSELARVMAEARVLVLPSRSEGFGRVALEAMSSRTPVIGSGVGGIVELIAPEETGFLVPPGDVAALSDRIAWMLDHPAEAAMMGAKARERARGLFSSESYVASYRRLIDEAVARR